MFFISRNLTDTNIEYGMTIYFVLTFCNVEDFKLFSFHHSLVESRSLPSVVQGAKNNIDLGPVEYEERFKLFFQELVTILDMDLGNVLMSISTTAELKNQDVLHLRNASIDTIGSGKSYQIACLYSQTPTKLSSLDWF